MPTANEQFLDAMIRHQIGLLRVAGKTTNEIIAILDATEKDLRAAIMRRLPAATTTSLPARTRRLLAAITAPRAEIFPMRQETAHRRCIKGRLSGPTHKAAPTRQTATTKSKFAPVAA